MDLGALVCVPASARMSCLPAAGLCIARERGLQAERPVRPARQAIPHYDAVAAIITDGAGRFLLARRPPHGLLGGLWEFPGQRRPESPGLESTFGGLPGGGREEPDRDGTDRPDISGSDRGDASDVRLAGLLSAALRSSLGIDIEVLDELVQVPHTYTHFRITLHAFSARIRSGEPRPLGYTSVKWVTPAELGDYALPATDRRIARALFP